MNEPDYEPPALDELEVSVFGPGYGEAILLHLGAGTWLLVDSCLEPASKHPASLNYLQQLKVDVTQAVKLVVATHWHDDHVRGISDLFEQCPQANFVISSALRNKEFLTLAALQGEPSPLKSSGLQEFSKVLHLLETRKQAGVRFNPPKLAAADKLLYRDHITLALKPDLKAAVETSPSSFEVKVFALSPSDAAVLQAGLAFTSLFASEKKGRKRLPALPPNHTSIVLWVEIGPHKILLGADLENTADPKTGWSVILNEAAVISGQADFFKVPHHGSEKAHHPDVWSELLSNEPFAVVSPFNRGKKPLPSEVDIERLVGLTPHIYATAPTRQQKIAWRNRLVSDYVGQMMRHIQPIHQGWGQVRLRKKMDAPQAAWQVALFGDAYALRQR